MHGFKLCYINIFVVLHIGARFNIVWGYACMHVEMLYVVCVRGLLLKCCGINLYGLTVGRCCIGLNVLMLGFKWSGVW